MRRLVLALACALMVPAVAIAQAPSPSPVPHLQTLCLRIVAPDVTSVVELIRMLDEGLARIVGQVPCREPFVEGVDGGPVPTAELTASPTPTAAPAAWRNRGSFRYRWEPPEDEAEGYLLEDRFVLRVIPDHGCARGLEVTLEDEYGESPRGRRTGRANEGRTTRVSFENDMNWYPDTVRVTAIRCITAASTFDEGTWRVGTDIRPGAYRGQADGDSACYWERLRGFGGEIRDIIANDLVIGRGQVVVRIRSSDRGFSSRNCGTWRRIGS